MNRSASVGLDAIRILAAFLVFACHFNQLGFSGPAQGVLEPLGRLGVVVFFVVSGFVIAYVCDEKHRTAGHYLEARLVRLSSVFVPALVVTFLFDGVGRWLDPSLYARYPAPAAIQPSTLALFLLYLHENAWTSVRWLSNGPMWSIAYEFWYYVGFAAFRFATPRWRWPLLVVVAVVAGWKILLLLPVWLLGVWLYYARERVARIRPDAHVIAAVAAVGLLTLWCTPAGYSWTAPLRTAGAVFGPGYQAMFLSDYVQGLLVAVIIASVVRGAVSYPARLGEAITHAAGMTFSLYMFHVPVILVLRSLDAYDASRLAPSVLAAGVALAACYGLSRVTERRKDVWHNAIAYVRSRLASG